MATITVNGSRLNMKTGQTLTYSTAWTIGLKQNILMLRCTILSPLLQGTRITNGGDSREWIQTEHEKYSLSV